MWIGTVTSLIPPNYGIVDGDSFYVNAVVGGQLPQVGHPGCLLDSGSRWEIPDMEGDIEGGERRATNSRHIQRGSARAFLGELGVRFRDAAGCRNAMT